MKNALLACLLLLSCLCTHRATAQQAVLLLPGDCLDRPFIGLDTAAYRATVVYLDQSKLALAAADTYAHGLKQELTLSDAASAVLKQELARCRQQNEATAADLQKVAAQAQRLAALPLRLPLLADSRFYKTIGVAGAGGLLLGLLLHR